jgi:hypothetical protein
LKNRLGGASREDWADERPFSANNAASIPCFSLFEVTVVMQSTTIEKPVSQPLATSTASLRLRSTAQLVPPSAQLRMHAFRASRACLRAPLAALAVSVALSGCGVFCGGAGGSGGGFAGGCGAGIRF